MFFIQFRINEVLKKKKKKSDKTKRRSSFVGYGAVRSSIHRCLQANELGVSSGS